MQEFVDFLAGQPPYDALEPDDVARLAHAVQVEFFAAGSTLFAAGDPPLERIHVLRSGTVELLDGGRVVDELAAGDTFGHVSVLSGMQPALSARSRTDVLCYLLPDPRTLLQQPQRLRFQHYGRDVLHQRLTGDLLRGGGRAEEPVRRHARPLVHCPAGSTVREVAQRITDAGQSCALLELDAGRLGLVTDADLRTAVAHGRSGDEPAAVIASSPVLQVGAGTPVAAALQTMVEHGVHHLLLHDPGGRPEGVVRVVDLASAEVRDPLAVRTAVAAATDLDALAAAAALLPATALELVDAGLPATRTGALLAAITEAVLRRCVDLGHAALPGDATGSWLALGSLARRESLISSDVDTALVFAPEGIDPHPAAESLLQALETCGLHRCAHGSNATEPAFARSTAGWAAATARWLAEPGADRGLLLATMMLDARPVSEPALGGRVTAGVLAAGTGPQFRAALLEYTVTARPPVGFVRDFVVEHSGEHHGQLHLKRGGLRPVASIGRWAAMLTGDASGGTPERLRRAEQAGLLGGPEADALIGAFEHVYDLLLRREAEAVRAGRDPTGYLSPGSLDPLERRHLRESFRAIDHVQSRLASQWSR